MGAKQVKLLTVAANGQISIGKAWAGKQIRLEEISESELKISSGVFIPDSQQAFFTKEAQETLTEFNKWESTQPPKETNTKKLFEKLRKQKK